MNRTNKDRQWRALFTFIPVFGAATHIVLMGVRMHLSPSTGIRIKNSNNASARCFDSWGVFERNQSTLTETQWIHRPNLRPPFNISTIDHSFDHLFIDPESNFAFCAIEKNACTQWQTVLRNVKDKRTTNGYERPDFMIGEHSQRKHGRDKIKDIFESPNSTVVVMVRDPLARFASVYLDKCFGLNCTDWHCLARTRAKPQSGQDKKVPKGMPISFRHALEWMLQDSVSVKTVDSHWSLQSERCGMPNGGLENYFSIVGKMTKPTLQQDASCIMKQAGIAKYNIAVSTSGANESDTTFWKSGGVKYRDYRHDETEEDVLRKLFTPETARRLMDKFRQDYDFFQLPEPDWIDQATGEWMDSLNHHECKVW